jgi:acetolactate synthase regulatory subunit
MLMSDPRNSAVADVYAGDTAAAQRTLPGAVFAYEISADPEPDVLARVAGICNLANVAPRQVKLTRDTDEVRISVQLDFISDATADSIRRKLQQLTCVNSVTLALLSSS